MLMLAYIDNFLNKITMYRLVLYFLTGLVLAALVLSIFGKLPFAPQSLLYSTALLTLFCWAANKFFSFIFKVPANVESAYISAFILALIISPARTINTQFLVFLILVSVFAQGSKYILALYRKHIFNPAAFAVVITAFTIHKSASWWVGTAAMLPFVLAGGLLVVRKIQRFSLVFSFLAVNLAVTLLLGVMGGSTPAVLLQTSLLNSALLFFAFIMLTEPLTTPPRRRLQIIYGVLVGFLSAPQAHIGSFYSTPELALLLGNIFSYAVSPKEKLLLELKQKIQLSPTVYDFIFSHNGPFNFTPGQYLEWTLGHKKPDSRGNRRYFTISSSPTEKEIHLGVKFYEPASSYKQALLALKPGDKILAGQLAGDFTLPGNDTEKSVFLAGGIGITPFRSMIKYLLDKGEKQNAVLFYSNKTVDEIVYGDVFEAARKNLGIKTVYTLTDTDKSPANWPGRVGQINERVIKEEVPDYKERTFYLSGPRSMVTAFENVLLSMGVRKARIKTDFFPGYA